MCRPLPPRRRDWNAWYIDHSPCSPCLRGDLAATIGSPRRHGEHGERQKPKNIGKRTVKIAGTLSIHALRIIKVLLCTLAAVTSTYALGQKRYVEFTSSPGAIRLGGDGVAAPIIVDSQDYPGVLRAAHDLQTDIERVTKIRPAVITDAPAPGADVIIVGTLGKDRLIDKLLDRSKLNVSAIRGRWESFLIQVVAQPWPGVKRALVIVGSDKRGS